MVHRTICRFITSLLYLGCALKWTSISAPFVSSDPCNNINYVQLDRQSLGDPGNCPIPRQNKGLHGPHNSCGSGIGEIFPVLNHQSGMDLIDFGILAENQQEAYSGRATLVKQLRPTNQQVD